MINEKLFSPKSIVVVGASNDTSKPGGKLLKNLIDTNYGGNLMVINPKQTEVQGIRSYATPADAPEAELAVLAIAAPLCPAMAEELATHNKTEAFIVISAGFSEVGESGAQLEHELVEIANKHNASLIGPNCIGLLTAQNASLFTTPIPKLHPQGVDLISGSGATAVFIMESAIPKGLRFNSVVSVGNSAQIGIEEVLEYMDETFDPEYSSKVKLLYIESIGNPDKLLLHASSLVRKGCKIAAIKAGSSKAGSRAASSHTGAMASSDLAVEALFRKAGIVRCYGREELTTVACVFMCKELKGENIAIITHAGGPAVMLTDALENGGLTIPKLPDNEAKARLKAQLFAGSSVENPIDFLATGTEEQLNAIIDACENDFEEIDAMAVIYGSPGLFPVGNVYRLLDRKMKTCKKPIYPILPSVINVHEDLEFFISHGNVNFPDEVVLGKALTRVHYTPCPTNEPLELDGVDVPELRRIVETATNGFQPQDVVRRILKAASIEMAEEYFAATEAEALDAASKLGFPVVMKVVGPLHKTDVGGVSLHIKSNESVSKEYQRLMNIEGAEAVLVGEMLKGTELFVGANYEPKFGHIILCGLGGIFVEVLKDVTSGLAPLTQNEAKSMIRNLKARKLIKGYRGTPAICERTFAGILVRLSTLLRFATEIKEMDINPIIGSATKLKAADVRIRIEK